MDNNVAYSGSIQVGDTVETTDGIMTITKVMNGRKVIFQGETFEGISFGVTNKVLDGMIRMIEERRERGRKILRCT